MSFIRNYFWQNCIDPMGTAVIVKYDDGNGPTFMTMSTTVGVVRRASSPKEYCNGRHFVDSVTKQSRVGSVMSLPRMEDAIDATMERYFHKAKNELTMLIIYDTVSLTDEGTPRQRVLTFH